MCIALVNGSLNLKYMPELNNEKQIRKNSTFQERTSVSLVFNEILFTAKPLPVVDDDVRCTIQHLLRVENRRTFLNEFVAQTELRLKP